MKVEDRLIGVGQMWKVKKELQMKAYIKEVESKGKNLVLRK